MTELTQEHFDETMRSLAKDLQIIQATQSEHTVSFKQIDSRLGAIETMLWQGQRLEEMSQRLLDLAKATGHSELPAPFMPSPGMASPMSAEAQP